MGDVIGLEYSEMTEGELLRVARSYDDLSDVAQAALRAEFGRRGMEAPLVEEEDAVNGRTLVTVRRYRDLSEAIVARSLLESSGIAVSLQDENLVRLDWQVSNFIGGMRLQVDLQDEAAALELLAQPVGETIEMGQGHSWFSQPQSPCAGRWRSHSRGLRGDRLWLPCSCCPCRSRRGGRHGSATSVERVGRMRERKSLDLPTFKQESNW